MAKLKKRKHLRFREESPHLMLVKKVARIADKYGMWACELARFPKLLKEGKVKPEEFTHTIGINADKYNEREFQKLLTIGRLNGIVR